MGYLTLHPPASVRLAFFRSLLGAIVLAANGGWVAPNPNLVFLGGGHDSGSSSLVDPNLQEDPETLTALKELGIKPVSAESVFKDAASGLLANDATRHQNVSTLDERWYEFWRLARDVDVSAAMTIIRECSRAWLDLLRVRTLAGRWCSLFGVLLPGAVVPEDGSRDRAVAIDIKFHQEDLPLLRELGVVDAPRPGHTMSPTTRRRFTDLCREEFKQQDLPRKPQPDKLNFYDTTTSGPMDVLESLTDEGKVLYTWRLLALDDTYKKWTMRHDTQDIYPPMDFESPALEALRRHGRIETEDGVHRLSDGLAAPPKNRSVLAPIHRRDEGRGVVNG